MAAQRERIFAALYDRLRAIQSGGGAYFKYTSRILESWDDTPPAVQPAFFLVKGNEEANIKLQGAPSGWRLTANLVVYLQNDETTHEDPSVAPSIELNNAITLVEAALQAQAGEQRSPFATFPGKQPGYFTTTLGGLCYSCQIVGTVQVFDGTIAGTAVAIIPIEILTTG
jgi:hypothetical protein